MTDVEFREVAAATADVIVAIRRLRTAQASLTRAGLDYTAAILEDDVKRLEDTRAYLLLTAEEACR